MRIYTIFNPEDIIRITGLFVKHKWLEHRQDAFSDLIDICTSPEEQLLLFDLIDRFIYLYTDDVKNGLIGIVDYIMRDLGLVEYNTQIVATTMDSEADSAQFILQMLKPIFAEKGWNKVKTANMLKGAIRNIGKYPNVVIIDEFSGTGKTIGSRFKWLNDCLLEEKRRGNISGDYSIYVCVLACMLEAKRYIEAKDIKFRSIYCLEKGISGYYNGIELDNAVNNMRKLENILVKNIDDESFPSFGSGRAEALYSMDASNTVNSVFPVFWWPEYLDGKTRRAILWRV